METDQWLLKARASVLSSSEWQAARRHLTDVMNKQLSTKGRTLFTELNDAEKLIALRNALKSLEGSPIFPQLSEQLSVAIEESLQEESLRNCQPDASERAAFVLESSVKTVAVLVERWPELKGCFQLCLNRPLSADLRSVFWRSTFLSGDFSSEFLAAVRDRPSETVSARSVDLVSRCVQVVKSESLNSCECWSANVHQFAADMLAILSYRDSLVSEELTDSHVFRLAPFLYVLRYCQVHDSSRKPVVQTARRGRSLTEALAEAATTPLCLADAERLESVVGCFLRFLKESPLCTESLESSVGGMLTIASVFVFVLLFTLCLLPFCKPLKTVMMTDS